MNTTPHSRDGFHPSPEHLISRHGMLTGLAFIGSLAAIGVLVYAVLCIN